MLFPPLGGLFHTAKYVTRCDRTNSLVEYEITRAEFTAATFVYLQLRNYYTAVNFIMNALRVCSSNHHLPVTKPVGVRSSVLRLSAITTS